MHVSQIVVASLAALPALAIAQAPAESTASWDLQQRAVYLGVYVHACEPVEYDFAGAKQRLTEAAAWMYAELFIKGYASSCRDFYYEEIVHRMLPTVPGPSVAKR
jgi:hypothetical protein